MASPGKDGVQADQSVTSRRSLPLSLTFSKNVWSLLALTLAVCTSIGVFAVTMNLYLVARGYREDFIGLVSFASAIALTAAAIPAGYLSNRFGARRCLVLGTVGLGVAGTLAATVSEPSAIVAAMVLHGAAQAFIFVPSTPYLMENARGKDHPRVFAASFAAMSLGGILGSSLGGFVPSMNLAGVTDAVGNYRVALLVGAALAVVGAIVMVAARERKKNVSPRPDSDSMPSATAATDLTSELPASRPGVGREIAAMAIATALLNVPTALLTVFFNVYLHEEIGAPTQAIGLIYAIGAAVMVPLGLAGPRIGARYGALRVIATTRFVSGFVVLLPAMVTSLGGGGAAFVFRSGLVGLAQPLDSAFVMGRMPRHLRAHVSAIRNMSLDISWAVTSIVAGFVVIRWGYRPIFYIGAICTVASAMVYYAVFRDATARPHDEPPGPADVALGPNSAQVTDFRR